MIPGLRFGLGAVATVATALLGVAFIVSFERPPVEGVQHGYRGTGMDQIFNPRTVAAAVPQNTLPPPEPAADPSGTPSSQAYQNVHALGDVDSNEFLRLMSAITSWVSPVQGCTYCHVEESLASDAAYQKVVARRMIQMVRYINTAWKDHVGPSGVTCYTCHRGNPVPRNIWFTEPGTSHFSDYPSVGKNLVSVAAGLSSLPSDPYTPFLLHDDQIRVLATQALPGTDRSSIKQTDWTYALMISMSNALGVNCTYCHNTRSFYAWDQSAPQRATAWYGIRMVRDLNVNYLEPLTSTFPHQRLGPTGDVGKINCATCHQGVFKPFYGASQLKDYPALATAAPPGQAGATPAATDATKTTQ